MQRSGTRRRPLELRSPVARAGGGGWPGLRRMSALAMPSRLDVLQAPRAPRAPPVPRVPRDPSRGSSRHSAQARRACIESLGVGVAGVKRRHPCRHGRGGAAASLGARRSRRPPSAWAPPSARARRGRRLRLPLRRRRRLRRVVEDLHAARRASGGGQARPSAARTARGPGTRWERSASPALCYRPAAAQRQGPFSHRSIPSQSLCPTSTLRVALDHPLSLSSLAPFCATGCDFRPDACALGARPRDRLRPRGQLWDPLRSLRSLGH